MSSPACLAQHAEGRGVTVEVSGPLYRTDLPIAEEPAQWYLSHQLTEQLAVMVGLAVEVFASSQAGEQQSAADPGLP